MYAPTLHHHRLKRQRGANQFAVCTASSARRPSILHVPQPHAVPLAPASSFINESQLPVRRPAKDPPRRSFTIVRAQAPRGPSTSHLGSSQPCSRCPVGSRDVLRRSARRRPSTLTHSPRCLLPAGFRPSLKNEASDACGGSSTGTETQSSASRDSV